MSITKNTKNKYDSKQELQSDVCPIKGYEGGLKNLWGGGLFMFFFPPGWSDNFLSINGHPLSELDVHKGSPTILHEISNFYRTEGIRTYQQVG